MKIVAEIKGESDEREDAQDVESNCKENEQRHAHVHTALDIVVA